MCRPGELVFPEASQVSECCKSWTINRQNIQPRAGELGSPPGLELMPLKVTEGSLCDVNPTLNRDPRTAMPFFEADHLAENNNAIAVRTVPESELRSARGITWARFFTIEPAVDVTAVAAEKVRGFHACRTVELNLHSSFRPTVAQLGKSLSTIRERSNVSRARKAVS
jgi:hypothetical protein